MIKFFEKVSIIWALNLKQIVEILNFIYMSTAARRRLMRDYKKITEDPP